MNDIVKKDSTEVERVEINVHIEEGDNPDDFKKDCPLDVVKIKDQMETQFGGKVKKMDIVPFHWTDVIGEMRSELEKDNPDFLKRIDDSRK